MIFCFLFRHNQPILKMIKIKKLYLKKKTLMFIIHLVKSKFINRIKWIGRRFIRSAVCPIDMEKLVYIKQRHVNYYNKPHIHRGYIMSWLICNVVQGPSDVAERWERIFWCARSRIRSLGSQRGRFLESGVGSMVQAGHWKLILLFVAIKRTVFNTPACERTSPFSYIEFGYKMM